MYADERIKKFWIKFKFCFSVVAACTVDFLKEVVDGNVIAMRKKYFYEDAQKWTDYKGPKNVFPFEVRFHFSCFKH